MRQRWIVSYSLVDLGERAGKLLLALFPGNVDQIDTRLLDVLDSPANVDTVLFRRLLGPRDASRTRATLAARIRVGGNTCSRENH
jgi:hypothetical protein